MDFTLNKRYSDKWQFNVAFTIQKELNYRPEGSFTNPTGVEYLEGHNQNSRFIFKLNGSYDLPWGIMASTNLNINDGDNRTMSIAGPGRIFNGVGSGTSNRSTMEFQPRGTTRLERTKLWDVGLNKTFTFRGGQNRVKFTVDGFNILNSAPVLRFTSNNLSRLGSTANPILPSDRIRTILAPRIFRAGVAIFF